MNAVIDHSVAESWWSSCVSQTAWGWRWRVAGGHCAGLRQPCSSSRLWPLLLGQKTFQQLHVYAPPRWNWATSARGASSSTGTMTPAGHGKMRHILAFAITSDSCDMLSVHRAALSLCKHFCIVLSQLFLNQLPNTFRTKSKSSCEDSGRAAESSGSLLWQ